MEYNESYFSASGALKEAKHVFVDPINWTDQHQSSCFAPRVMGEIGFGFGVNFLCTLSRHRAIGDLRWLHYFAVERQIPDRRSWNRFHRTLWTSCHQTNVPSAADRINLKEAGSPPAAAGYPASQDMSSLALSLHQTIGHQGPGRWRILLPDFRCILTLVVGEADGLLELDLGRQCSGWFLDGFSPRVNASAWSANLLKALVGSCHSGGRIMSYSVASSLCRNLTELGCLVDRRPGLPPKRYALLAHVGLSQDTKSNRESKCPESPQIALPTHCQHKKRLAVIGAGIAGAWISHLATRQGWDVTCYDPYDPGPIIAFSVPRVLRPDALLFDVHRQAWLFLQSFIDAVLVARSDRPDWLSYFGPLWDVPQSQRQWDTWDKSSDVWPARRRHSHRLGACMRWPHIPVFNCLQLKQMLLQETRRVYACVQDIATKTDSVIITSHDGKSEREDSFNHLVIATGGPPVGLDEKVYQGLFSKQDYRLTSGAMALNPTFKCSPIAVKTSTLAYSSARGCIISAGFQAIDTRKRIQARDVNTTRSGAEIESWSSEWKACRNEAIHLQKQWSWGGDPEAWEPFWFGSRASAAKYHPYVGLLRSNIGQINGLGAHGFTLAPFLSSVVLDMLGRRPVPLPDKTIRLLRPSVP